MHALLCFRKKVAPVKFLWTQAVETHRASLTTKNKEWPSVEGPAEAPGTSEGGEQSGPPGQEEVDSDLRERSAPSSLLAIIGTRFA